MRDYQKERQSRITKGVCLICKEQALPNKKTCGRHNETLNIRRIKLVSHGLCRNCGKPAYIKGNGKLAVWCKDCYLAKNKRLGRLNTKYLNLPCVICGWSIACDTHHKDGNHKNNAFTNLIVLCPNHHRLIELGLLSLN